MRVKKDFSSSPFNFHFFGYRFLGDRPARIFPLSKLIRRNLLRASIKVNHVVYISSMFFWTIIVSALAFTTSLLLFTYVFPILGIWFSTFYSIIYSLLAGVLGGGVTFTTFFYYPYYVASNLKRNIERNLVYIANYMAMLSGAGATPGEIFISLARVGEVFGLKESARSIVKRVEFLGEDIVSAIDEESRITPSEEYAGFLQGYIATLRTGGDPRSYLTAMSEKFMDSRRRLLSKLISQLNMAGEIFVAALVAFPIILITILSIMGFLGGTVLGGLSAPQLMALVVYILVPFTAIGVLILIDTIMSSW